VKLYKSLLAKSKSSAQTKRLAARFIPKFANKAAAMADEGLEALIDLCEEDDIEVPLPFFSFLFLSSYLAFVLG
jgi:hypothetical protein